MPMSTQVRGVARNCDEVAESWGNIAIAARAEVCLRGLIWLNSTHLDRPIKTVPDASGALWGHDQPSRAQATKASAAAIAAATNT